MTNNKQQTDFFMNRTILAFLLLYFCLLVCIYKQQNATRRQKRETE
jgi:hypothetical protein